MTDAALFTYGVFIFFAILFVVGLFLPGDER